jgi:hypothetical protein
MAEPSSPGINDWLREHSTSDAQAIMTMGTEFDNGLIVLHRGSPFVEGQPRWADLARAISSSPIDVVIDAGISFIPEELRQAVSHITMVVKPCYLSLRRASRMQRPTELFVVCEEGRALTIKDVGHVLGMPVTCEVPYTPAISRAVDAGMLPSRAEQLFGPYMTSM